MCNVYTHDNSGMDPFTTNDDKYGIMDSVDSINEPISWYTAFFTC